MEDIPIRLYPGLRLGQVTFSRLTSAPARSYGSVSKAKFNGHINPEKGSAIADREIPLLREASRKHGHGAADDRVRRAFYKRNGGTEA